MFGVDHSGSRAHLCSSAGLHHTAAHHHHSRERPDKELQETQLKSSIKLSTAYRTITLI